MKSFLSSSAAIAAIILSSPGAESFAPPSTSSRRVAIIAPSASLRVHRHYPQKRPTSPSTDNGQSELFASKHDPPSDEVAADGDAVAPPSRRGSRFLRNLRRRSKPVALALLAATGGGAILPGTSSLRNLLVPPARASTPIVLRENMPKEEPPMIQAEKKAEELRKKKSMDEFDAFMAKANDIEEEQGKAARDEYETQYQLDKAAKAAQLKVDVELLKRKLLDAGKDPFTDVDAQREVFLLEKDIDLEKVQGTDQNIRMINNWRKRGKGIKTFEDQRYIVACQVADLKARGIDPMEFFGDPEGMDKTHALYRMDDKVAAKVAAQYRGLMEKYGGRLSPAQEGEVPFAYPDLESAAAGGETAGSAKEAKAIARAKANSIRTAQKEAAREARAKARAERAEARVQAKADKAAAKDARLAEKAAGAAAALAAKEAATAAASVAATAASSVAEGDVAADVAIGNNAVAESSAVEKVTTQQTAAGASSKAKGAISELKKHATPKNAAAVLVVGGAATYGFNYYRENNGAAQSERERQLKLILGNEDEEEDDDDEEFDDDEDDEYEQFTKKKPEPPKSKPKSDDDTPKASKPAAPPTPPPAVPAPKPKRTLGIFAKRNANMRETDLNALVGTNAQAPEFAKLLSQILTFGAPGRFPAVSSWGAMPLDEFDLDVAKSLLTECREEADLADERSAEIFASVVNCMIIDIVDLASSTLKGKNKEEKVTVDAINVVMDFMDHAASLFDAVAKDVTIKPVTYGGKLRKKDLEEMFSIYAGSSMMSLDGTGTTQDRVDTLQLVFAITDKKAEGLMQKHMMKMMMNLMKDGGKGLEGMEGMPGMEGMEDMMKAMGGAGGMGMPGMDGGEISPEELKQTLGMMKDLMDSGQVSDEELVEVRSQFKEMYGSDISDLIKKADEEGAGEGMTEDERELLDMFKRILGEE